MAKRRSKKEKLKKELLEQGYLECYYCDELVKSHSLRCPHCRKWFSSGKRLMATIVAIIIILSTVGTYYYISPGRGGEHIPTTLPTVLSATPTGTSVPVSTSITVKFNKEMDRDSVESSFSISPSTTGSFSWSGNTLIFVPSKPLAIATSYTVSIGAQAMDKSGNHLDSSVYKWYFMTEGGATARRDIGSGDNDFWVEYPLSHPQTGQSVNHLQWVKNAVETKVVLILTHSEGCYPCIVQGQICEAVYASHSGDVTYYDLISGTNEPQASQTFSAYDPNGDPHYIPLTIVLTKVPDSNGDLVIGWHSWEGVVDESTLNSWIGDAISYHNENS